MRKTETPLYSDELGKVSFLSNMLIEKSAIDQEKSAESVDPLSLPSSFENIATPFNKEKLEETWQSIIAAMKDEKRIPVGSLDGVSLRLDESNFLVTVIAIHEMQYNALCSIKDAIEKILKIRLQNTFLELIIHKAERESLGKVYLTDKEKYELFKENNPEMVRLEKYFKLRLSFDS